MDNNSLDEIIRQLPDANGKVPPKDDPRIVDYSKQLKTNTQNSVQKQGGFEVKLTPFNPLPVSGDKTYLSEFNVPIDAIYDKLNNGKYVAKFKNYKGAVGNEDRLAKEQSAGEQFLYGLTKNVRRAGNFALDQTFGTLYGIGQAIQEGKWKGLWDNDFSRTMDDWNKQLDYKLPNYYTDEQKSMSWLRSMGTMNFWANDVANGLAFVGGTILSGAAMSLLTGGASAAGGLAKLGFKLGTKGALSYTDDIAKQVTRYAIESEKGRQLLRGLQYANIGKKAGTVLDTGAFLVRSSMFEAGMEARHNFREATDKYILNFEDKNGRPPTSEELQKFLKQAESAANNVFGMNLAVLAVSNAAMYGKALGISDSFGVGVNNSFNKLIGLGVRTDLNTGRLIMQQATRPQKVLGKAYKLLGKSLISEGLFEEGLQGVAGTTMQNYLETKYDPKANDADSMFNYMGEAFKDQYTSNEGWKEIVIGGIIGMVGGTLQIQRKDGGLTTGGIQGFGQNSYRAAQERITAGVTEANKAADSVSESLNKRPFSSLMADASFAKRSKEDVTNPNIENFDTHLNYIRANEQFFSPSELESNFETIVNNTELTQSQKTELERAGITEAEYKAKQISDFQSYSKSYGVARRAAEALILPNVTDGNKQVVVDAYIRNVMLGEEAIQHANQRLKKIAEKTNIDGGAIHFYNNLEEDKKQLVEEHDSIQNEIDEISKAFLKLSTAQDIETKGEATATERNTKAEQRVALQQRLDEKLARKEAIENILSQDLKINQESLNQVSELQNSFTTVQSALDSLKAYDNYVANLRSVGRTEEADALEQDLYEYKMYSDMHREFIREHRAMLSTNFFSSEKGKGLLGKLIGPIFSMSPETLQMIEEDNAAFDKAIRDVLDTGTSGTTRDELTQASVAEQIKDLLEKNGQLSDREKFRLEALTRLVITTYKPYLNQTTLSEKMVEQTEEQDILEGDTIALIRKPVNQEEQSTIEAIESQIQDITSQLEDFLNLNSPAKKQRIKDLEDQLTKLQEELDNLKTQPAPQQTQAQDISDTEYQDFVDNGIVSEQTLQNIAEKVKNNQQLTDRENAIFTDKTAEINDILTQQNTQTANQNTKSAVSNIGRSTSVESVLTDEQRNNLDKAKKGEKAEPAKVIFNSLNDLLNHSKSLIGKKFNVRGIEVEFIDYKGEILTGAGQRVFVKVLINGVPVTFYSSTGSGKKSLQEGIFYPTLGIESDERFNGTWINKIDGIEMASYYNSASLAAVGAFLDSQFGNTNSFAGQINQNTLELQNPEGKPLTKESALEIRREYNKEFLNSDRDTFSNNERTKVVEAFKNLVEEINTTLEKPNQDTNGLQELQQKLEDLNKQLEQKKADIERRRRIKIGQEIIHTVWERLAKQGISNSDSLIGTRDTIDYVDFDKFLRSFTKEDLVNLKKSYQEQKQKQIDEFEKFKGSFNPSTGNFTSNDTSFLDNKIKDVDAELAALEKQSPSTDVVASQELETKKADILLGKVGNTEYEVKADGVYYQGKKLDNPENKTFRQLIEADIKRRKQEELLTPQSLDKLPDYLAEGITKAVEQLSISQRYEIVKQAISGKTAQQIVSELNLIDANGRRNTEIVRQVRVYYGIPSQDTEEYQEWKNKVDKINAKYDAEIVALEQQSPSTDVSSEGEQSIETKKAELEQTQQRTTITQQTQEIPRENISFFVSGGAGVGHQAFPSNKATSDYDIRGNSVKLKGFRYVEHPDGSISFHIPYTGLDVRGGSHLGIAIKGLKLKQIDETSVKRVIEKLGEALSKIPKNTTGEERLQEIERIGNQVLSEETVLSNQPQTQDNTQQTITTETKPFSKEATPYEEAYLSGGNKQGNSTTGNKFRDARTPFGFKSTEPHTITSSKGESEYSYGQQHLSFDEGVVSYVQYEEDGKKYLLVAYRKPFSKVKGDSQRNGFVSLRIDVSNGVSQGILDKIINLKLDDNLSEKDLMFSLTDAVFNLTETNTETQTQNNIQLNEEISNLEQQISETQKQIEDATQNNQQQEQENPEQGGLSQYTGVDEGQQAQEETTQSETNPSDSSVRSEEIQKEINVIEEKLRKEKELIKIMETEDYVRMEELLGVENRTPEQEDELRSLKDDFDTWMLATGIISKGVRLSDLIEQKVALEKAEIRKTEFTVEPVAEEVATIAELNDSRKGKIYYENTQTHDAVTIDTRLEDNSIRLSGLRAEDIPSIFTETINGEIVPIIFEFEVDLQNGNILIPIAELEKFDTPESNVMLRPGSTGITQNYSILYANQVNEKGEQSWSPVKSTFTDYNNPQDIPAIYNLEVGDDLTLFIDTRDEFNANLIAAYNKVKGKVGSKAEKEARENLIKNLRINTYKGKSNLSDLKAITPSDITSDNDEIFASLRRQVIEDNLEKITDKGAVVNTSVKIKTKKILPGHPTFNVEKRGSQYVVVPKAITKKQTEKIVDLGVRKGDETLQTRAGKGDSKIDTTYLPKNGKDIAFVVIEVGNKKIAYPVKLMSQDQVDLEAFRKIYNETQNPTKKAILLNEFLANSGLDIKKKGNAFYSFGKENNLDESTFENMVSKLEKIEYLYPLKNWLDTKIPIEEAAQNATVNLDLNKPFHSPKIEFDLSQFNKKAPTSPEETATKTTKAKEKTVGVKGFAADALNAVIENNKNENC